jgi:hypothetical protein
LAGFYLVACGYVDGYYYSGDWANYVVAGLLAGAASAGGWGWRAEDVGLAGNPDVDLLAVAAGDEGDGVAVFQADAALPAAWRGRGHVDAGLAIGVGGR